MGLYINYCLPVNVMLNIINVLNFDKIDTITVKSVTRLFRGMHQQNKQTLAKSVNIYMCISYQFYQYASVNASNYSFHFGSSLFLTGFYNHLHNILVHFSRIFYFNNTNKNNISSFISLRVQKGFK